MSTVGTRKNTQMGRGYQNDPIHGFAASFNEVASNILHENNIDIYTEPKKIINNPGANEALMNFFVENSAQRESFFNAEAYQDHLEMMKEQYINDREAMLEYSAMGEFNPIIGMTFPMHKNLLMNNVFDKGAIPKVVAREPKFTLTMETRILVAPDGTEIDMFKEQYKMTDAIKQTAPFIETVLTLPETGQTDILAKIGATTMDNLSIESYVSQVKVSVYLEVGDINPETGKPASTAGAVEVWMKVKAQFTPAYGQYDRTIMYPFEYKGKILDGSDVKLHTYKDVLSGYVQDNKVTIQNVFGVITAVKFRARIDTSNAMVKTCRVKWSARTDIIEIPTANPINITLAPEEVKDIGALYQVNQLTKIMSLLKVSLGNYKDDLIKDFLDESYLTMPKENKMAATYDFAPPKEGHYAFDYIEWRHKTFMDQMDTHVQNMIQVLNDPNMTITVFGRPDLIRKITPTEYTYQTPSSIGPVELDFVKTVTTSDKRVYQFIGSDKLRGNNNLIVILTPRNTERIVYRIYDYQMYVSNEIRNAQNPSLPAVHAFERFKCVEYQPVQGRIRILNPMGSRETIDNMDPIGKFEMNDYNSNKPEPTTP